MDGDVVSAERIIPAPPEAVFGVIADPVRHPEFDGSGQLRGVKPGTPERLVLGATFGMSMRLGMGYSMRNTVIEFEENRRIAWRATLAGPLGRFLGGRIWRYELEPVAGGPGSARAGTSRGTTSGASSATTRWPRPPGPIWTPRWARLEELAVSST